MKREIKFRGRRIDNGQWVEGMLDYRITSGTFAIHVTADLPPTQFEPGGDIYSEYFEVDPETVGQYTGFKNGDIEFYEDMYVQHTDNKEWYGQIEFDSIGKWVIRYMPSGRTALLADRIDYIEVIENPEILTP